jgi:hypothetical protein
MTNEKAQNMKEGLFKNSKLLSLFLVLVGWTFQELLIVFLISHS